MVFRVEVSLKQTIPDPAGLATKRRIFTDLGLDKVKNVRVLKGYLVDIETFKERDLERTIHALFSDPVVEMVDTGENLASLFSWDWLVDVSFLPGVTDNEGKTALWGVRTILGGEKAQEDRVFSSRKYLLEGEITEDEIQRISQDVLHNTLIQKVTVISRESWDNGRRVGSSVPRVEVISQPTVEEIDLALSDDELLALSRSRTLALNLEEMKAIRNYFSDTDIQKERLKKGFPTNATDCEVEVLAQTWSEHCKHKIFAADIEYEETQTGKKESIKSLYKTFVKQVTKDLRSDRPWIKSVFHDNAGIIELDDDHYFAMKVETHNSPSALDPYGGALTGIVGVNRDIMGVGLGAKPIFNTDMFCFASPYYSGELPGANLMHPARIFRGVHQGIKDGGNESGIPVVNGSIFFDNRFIGKPLVFCGTGGLMPKKVAGRPSHKKRALVGDFVVMTGGRVGKDGIHGATFSSEELNESSPVTAVQIGDAIVQKRMLDFILEARDLGLFSAITDNGAGGLSSSVGEMATDTNGVILNLEAIPLKYEGLQPWEIFISEAQERMTLSVPPKEYAKLLEIAAIHEVEISNIGTFTDSGYLEVFHDNNPVALIGMDFLHNGLPTYQLHAVWDPKEREEWHPEGDVNLNITLLDMLGRLNISSKEEWVRQYDHEVQGRSAGKPFCGKDMDGPSDAAVVRIEPTKLTAVVVAHGLRPVISDIDAYNMTASVIDEAVRNAVSVGADPDFMSGLDNFCWPDPVYHPEKNRDGKHKLAQLVRSNKALYEFCKSYGIPLISGKDSMKNDYGSGENKISVPPTLLFTLISKMDNVEKMITMDVKKVGDVVYLIGSTLDELGASEYAIYHGKKAAGNAPTVNSELFMDSYRKLHKAINANLISSAHDLSDGGLAVAAAESAFAGGFGMKIDLRAMPLDAAIDRDDIALFSESNGRIVVTVKEGMSEQFEQIMAGLPIGRLGEVTSSNLFKIIGLKGEMILSLSLDEMKTAWKTPMSKMQ
ncbi:phosphoribosylformylglycinamidine synthase subunit PurS [bacterium]|nr:phosphoribosylformylglycinamidine synthase subunit PurS [bacterium]